MRAYRPIRGEFAPHDPPLTPVNCTISVPVSRIVARQSVVWSRHHGKSRERRRIEDRPQPIEPEVRSRSDHRRPAHCRTDCRYIRGIGGRRPARTRADRVPRPQWRRPHRAWSARVSSLWRQCSGQAPGQSAAEQLLRVVIMRMYRTLPMVSMVASAAVAAAALCGMGSAQADTFRINAVANGSTIAASSLSVIRPGISGGFVSREDGPHGSRHEAVLG